MDVPPGRQYPTVAMISRLCAVPEEYIAAAYVGGSRCFGTSTANSDFDLTVVLSAHVGPLGPAPVKRPPPPPLAPPNLHEQILQKVGDHGDVDIHLLSASLWQQMLDDNNVHALTCECLAPPFALCKPKLANKWTISFMRLKHQVYRYSHDHEQKAKTLWEKGQRPSSVKCVVHGLRAMRFGLQLAQRGVVYDLGAANATLASLLAAAPSCASWEAFVSLYKAMWDKEFEDFAAVVNAYKLSPEFLTQMTPHETVAGYIKGRSAEELLRTVAVNVNRPYAEFPELMQLHLDPVSSPHRFELTCLCAGTVVDVSRGFLPVCLPFRAFPHWDDDLYSEEKFVPKLHMPSVAVYRKRNGLSAFLFSHKGKWLVASHGGLSIYAQGLCIRKKVPFPTGITEAVSEVFWSLWNASGLRLPSAHDGRQYFFSLSEFAAPTILLVGARSTDGAEVPPAPVAAEHGWPAIADERASVNVANVTTLAEQLCAAEYEGYILCDQHMNRVSYKSSAYRALTFATLTPFVPSTEERELRFFVLVRHLGLDAERIARFCELAPQLREWTMALFGRCKAWLAKADALYASVSPSCTQAEFSAAIARASAAQKKLLFEVRKDGSAPSPSAYVCSPALFGDVKLTRRLYQSIAED